MDEPEAAATAAPKNRTQVRRQAVIVIHGIGEQRPMSTLRNLAATLLGERQMSRHDRAGGLWEIRRLRAIMDPPQDDEGDFIETDFYELYWAHLVRDTHWLSVLRWAWHLCWQPVLDDHAQRARLRLLWPAAVGLAISLVLGALYAPEITGWVKGIVDGGVLWLQARCPVSCAPLADIASRAISLALAAGIPLLLTWWLTRSFLVDILGDAARYLSPEPANVEARQKVIASGMALLRELHSQKHLKRIVVVGHSLGSIIGYDLLSTFFADQAQQLLVKKRSLDDLVAKAEALLRADPRREPGGVPRAPATAENHWNQDYQEALAAYQAEQDRCFRALRSFATDERKQPEGRRWLISDFITCGSPLAYMDFLRRRTRAEHERALARGDAASCPPEPLLDRDPRTLASQGPGYTYLNRMDGDLRLHQAALFALCRWTNLYYPGDIAGGPLRDLFGIGIDDRRLEPEEEADGKAIWSRRPGSHVRYWQTDKRDAPLAASRRTLGRIIFGDNWAQPPAVKTARPVNLVYTRFADAPRDPWTGAEQ